MVLDRRQLLFKKIVLILNESHNKIGRLTVIIFATKTRQLFYLN